MNRSPKRAASRKTVAWATALGLCLIAACDEDAVTPGFKTKETTAKDTTGGGDGAGGVGLGKACKGNADCKSSGLNCFLTDEVNLTGICSRVCESADDCGGSTHCNPVSGVLICTLPRYCDPCQEDADCGPEAPICVARPSKPDVRLCSQNCQTGDGSCAAGSSCVQFGGQAKDFACMPDYGSCTGGGEHCSPCKGAGDCALGTECLQASADTERFCAQLCDTAGGGTACPTGYKCTKYGGKGYCFQIVGKDEAGKTLTYPTCATGKKGFCDACEHDWECLSKRCVSKNNESYCAQPNPCTKAGEGDDCPYGGVATFCVSSNKGMVCAPPLAHHCHGFKSCLHALCTKDQICDNGLCKTPSP